MHDDLLERQLRTALREDAGRLSFTITADELERRAVLGGRRGAAHRRLSLLLAAALAIGGLGAGTLIAGLGDPSPLPSAPVAVDPSTPSAPDGTPPPTGEALLPTLDELIVGVDPDRVLVAHARDPLPSSAASEVELGAARVELGTFAGGAAYELRIACESPGDASVEISVPGSIAPGVGPRLSCTGATNVVPVSEARERAIAVSIAPEARLRVAVVRTTPRRDPPIPVVAAPRLHPLADHVVLIDAHDQSIPADGPAGPWGQPMTGLGALPARWSYGISLWCQGGEAVRYLHGGTLSDGDDVPGRFAASTLIDVPCDGDVHQAGLGFPEVNGTEAFLAAAPGTRWSVLVSADRPPVGLVEDIPGWRLSVGTGPSLAFATGAVSVSGQGLEGGGPLMIALECAGEPATIEVSADLVPILGDGKGVERFTATCAPGGARTTQSFPEAELFIVDYDEPAGSWTSMTVLIPEASAQP